LHILDRKRYFNEKTLSLYRQLNFNDCKTKKNWKIELFLRILAFTGFNCLYNESVRIVKKSLFLSKISQNGHNCQKFGSFFSAFSYKVKNYEIATAL